MLTKEYKIFTFIDFEGEIPPYLLLCIETWKKQLQNSFEIIVLNRTNVTKYIESYLLTESVLNPFKTDSLMFYDYMALLVLYCNGGVFIDADTIITDSFEPDFSLLKNYGAVAFSEANTGVCSGFLMSERHSPVLAELIRRYRFENYLPRRNIARNSIFQDVLYKIYKEQTFFYDAIDCGYLSEVKEFGSFSKSIYRKYYFSTKIPIEKFLKNTSGITSLRNSLTPVYYQKMSAEKLLRKNILLSKIFRVLL